MRRAQTSTIDFLIGVFIIVTVSVIVFQTALPSTPNQTVREDAQRIAQAIFSPYPPNTTNGSFITPGFVVDHRLDESLFAQISEPQFSQALNLRSNYYITTPVGVLGQAPSSESVDVYRVTRFAAHQGNITPIEVISWTE